jgi:uncharacterized protein (TIGR03437 family)
MDDAKTHLNRIAFIFLTLALVIAAPWSAQAQTFTQTTYGPVQLAVPGGSQVTIAGTEDTGTPTAPITFTASSITYGSSDRPWLEVGSDASCTGSSSIHYTTPATIGLNVLCYSGQLLTGSHTATVNLTSTSPTGLSATITVNYTVGSGSGGGGSISTSSSSVTLSAAVGGNTSQSVTLSTSSVSSISYTTNAQPASWLTVLPSSGTVSASASATLNFFASAAGISSPTTLGPITIYVYYNGTSSSVPITVSFIVGGGGSGTLTLSQSTVSWSYVTSGSLPSATAVYIYNSTATYYGLSFIGSPLFLTANGASSNTSSVAYTVGTPIALSPNGTVLAGLSTGTYYNYVTVTDSNGHTATLTVVLTVNSGSSGVITVSPDPISLNAAYLGGTVSTTVSVTSTITGTLIASLNTSGLSLSNTTASITAGTPVYLTVFGTPGSLPASTYTGSFSVTVAPTSGTAASLTVPAAFTITGSGGTGTSGVTLAPSTFQFNYEQGYSAPQSQSLTINGTTGGSDTYSISSPSQSWLEIGSSIGPAPAVVPLYIVNASSLPTGTSTATFTVTTTIGGYTSAVPVTVNVLAASSGVPVLVVQTNNGGSINLSYIGGSANPPAQALYLSASDQSAQAFTAAASPSWITLSSTTGTTPASLSVSLNASSLPNGINSGNITITGSFGTTTVPVVVYVTASSTTSSGVLTLSQSSLTFNAVVNSTPPSSQTLTVNASAATSFTASGSGTSGSVTWLSISPSGSLSTNQTLTISVNQSGLPIGTYAGYISLVTSSGTQTVPVTMNVTNGSNTVSASPTALTFGYITGNTSPSPQQISVTAAGSTAVTFTIADSVTSGGNWLILTTTAGNSLPSGTAESTGYAFMVNVNPTGLSAGTYNGTVTLTPSGGTAVSIPVTLTVTGGSTVSATPSGPLSFSYQVGGNAPAAQSISVAGAGNAALAFTATPTSTGGWLLVNGAATATSVMNTPASLSVTVAPSSLAAGNYTGTIVVAGSGSANGSTTVTVMLTVTAPLPTVTAVVNAASFASGKIAPGEIVTIGGTSLGPANGLGLTLNSTGTVSTSLGNVSVSFSGYPSPLVYVSQTQINCVVPYGVAGLVSPFVQVTYAGQTSNVFSLGAVATAPGIFTLNGQGSGPAAVLNASGTVNGPNNPAAKGAIIVIYMTGEGQTSPLGVTGSVTAVTTHNGAPFTPQPLLPVAVTIGGQPATPVFYGEAPGDVAGVMQLNVIVPTAAASGADALVVSVGGNPSQSGVTVSVQ